MAATTKRRVVDSKTTQDSMNRRAREAAMTERLHYDAESAIEIAPGVFHLGVQDEENCWANVPYMIVDGDEVAIIDPGSARPEFYEVVLRKIRSVVDPGRIKHVIVQHQDPDLCAALPLLEPLIRKDYELRTPLEARILVRHYGLSHEPVTVEDGDTLVFGNGRTLIFAMTPYCHFVGSMVTYDVATRTVFSSDAFGGFSADDALYAGEAYSTQMETFLGEYLGSKRALEYALKRLELLQKTHGIERICPQHGCVIQSKDIATLLHAAHQMRVGGQIDALARKHGIALTEGD